MATHAATAATASTLATTSPPTFNPLMQSTCAVLNLVACCGLGITASKAKVLDQQAISALSRLVYNVFQPSLLFTNVLQTLATPSQSRATLLLLPLAAALQIFVASVLSSSIIRIVGLNPQSEAGREARICSTFANSGPLPLLFVDALFKQHPDPTMKPRAVAFISFYLLSWSPLFWNYGYSMVIGKEKENEGMPASVEVQHLLSKKGDGPPPPPPHPLPTLHGVSGSGVVMEEGGTGGTGGSVSAYPSPPISQQCARDPAGFLLGRVKQMVTSNAVKKLINPPTLGCTVGALVGVIPPLRR